MKKLILALSILLSNNAYADVISLGTVSSDISVVNSNFSTIANMANGNIEGSTDSGATVSNIKADTVYEINMADDANGRVRDAELFNITVDTISGGAISSQGTVVESGCVQATDSDLTADVSACVVYINGYRVSKSATSQTYSNNTTTYLWLSQSGVYNLSTNPDTTIANSALLAKVVTSGGAITTVTNLFTTRVPGLIIPTHYRSGMVVSKDSATTLTVQPGTSEINSTMVAKTTPTTLTITTAGDWAGGSSLRAATTYAFVGIDASGNLKMHTTAPTHADYAVSATGGKKRYATWSATVYRILGWFYMDGAQNVENASNIKEGDVSNTIASQDGNIVSFTDTNFTVDMQTVNFYNSGGNILVASTISADSVTGFDHFNTKLYRDSTSIGHCGSASGTQTNANGVSPSFICLEVNRPQGSVTYRTRGRLTNSANLQSRNMVLSEQ